MAANRTAVVRKAVQNVVAHLYTPHSAPFNMMQLLFDSWTHSPLPLALVIHTQPLNIGQHETFPDEHERASSLFFRAIFGPG